MAQEDAVVQVEYSTFHYNDGLEGGAIFAQGSTVHLQQAEFLGNEAIVAVSGIIKFLYCFPYQGKR